MKLYFLSQKIVFISVFILTLSVIFLSNSNNATVSAAICGQPCIQTADCTYGPPPTPISGGTVTCSTNNGGGNYSVGAGTCSCSVASSSHCPSLCPWGQPSACLNGFQIQWCTCYGQDTQVSACTMPTPIPSPVPTAAPTCTISLSPATNNLTLGGANGTIDATVNCTAAVNQVTFTVSPAGIASVTSPGTVVTPNTTYRTTVTPVSVGGTVVTGHVFSGGVERASATAIVNVTALAGWFQVRDADVHSGGSLTTRVLAPNVFGLPGTGGFPGVPAYTSGTDLTPARASLTYGWLVQNTASPSLRKFDYDSLANQIPDTTTINSITLNSIGGATLASGGTLDAATGYYWYKYDGTSTGNLTLTSAADLLSRKVVLLVDNANFIINAPINVTDGQGFFMVLVKGNITVGSGVGGAAPQAGPNLEGIYEADNAFSDSAGNTQLRLRGSLVAHGLTGGVVSLLRDLGAGNVANPAELFEFAPDQILLYPPTLGVRKLNWKEVAP